MRNGLAVVLASLALVAGCLDGGGGGGGGGPSGETPCGTFGECPDGLVCDPVSDLCVEPSGYDWCQLVLCDAGQVCDRVTFECVPLVSCSQLTCSAGSYCDPYKLICTPNPQCGPGGVCPQGFYCDEHLLCVQPGPGGCFTTADCQDGYACDVAAHLCRGEVTCADQSGCPRVDLQRRSVRAAAGRGL